MFIAAAFLAATVAANQPVIDHVKAALRDPDSAQFRDIKQTPNGYCGWVNAKNGFGGYIGYAVFSDIGGKVTILDAETLRLYERFSDDPTNAAALANIAPCRA